MKYNFDEIIDRSNTYSFKRDCLPEGAPKDSLSFWVADMDFPCADPVIEALHQRIDRKIYGYTAYDNQDVYEAVSGWFMRQYGWKIEREELSFSPGVVPALAFLIRALTEPGDGIIIQRPVYYPFTIKIENAGRRVVNNPLTHDGNTYRMDYIDLEEKLKNPQNKGIIICSPHNPVGRVWTEDELRQLVDLCKKYNKWIISDEIHCDLTRKGMKHHPLLTVAPDYKDQIIACTAPSKTFNLAGMQISNIVIPNKEYKAKFDFLLDDCFGLMAAPLGISAMIAAYTHGEEWLDQVREYIDENIAYVHDFLQKNMPEVTMSDTQGTYLIWLDFRAYCNDEKKLEKLMHESAKVALDEGYIFGDEGKGFERINMASPRSMIVECMERIHKALKPEV